MILLDANHLGFWFCAGLKDARSPNAVAISVIERLRTIRDEHAGRMIALWDARSWRYDVFPDYKGNRKSNPQLLAIKQRWVAEKPLVAKFMRCMNISQLHASNMEADDLAARIVSSPKNKDSHITLITGDKDWLQLVDERVTWFDPIRNRRCRQATFEEVSGCKTPKQFIQHKALTGDVGDNIPPAGGVGPVNAKWIFDNMQGVDELLNESIMGSSRAWPGAVRAFCDDQSKIDTYRRNLKLVWLNHPEVPAAKDPLHVKGVIDVATLAALAEDINYHSIYRNPDAWVAPFRNEQ